RSRSPARLSHGPCRANGAHELVVRGNCKALRALLTSPCAHFTMARWLPPTEVEARCEVAGLPLSRDCCSCQHAEAAARAARRWMPGQGRAVTRPAESRCTADGAIGSHCVIRERGSHDGYAELGSPCQRRRADLICCSGWIGRRVDRSRQL